MNCINAINYLLSLTAHKKDVALDSLRKVYTEACADSVVKNYWYSYYDDAFNKLISTYTALFAVLLTTVIMIFLLKYWYDNKQSKKQMAKSLRKMKTHLSESLATAMEDAQRQQKLSLEQMFLARLYSEWDISPKAAEDCEKIIKNVGDRLSNIDENEFLMTFVYYLAELKFDKVFEHVNGLNWQDPQNAPYRDRVVYFSGQLDTLRKNPQLKFPEYEKFMDGIMHDTSAEECVSRK